MVDEFPIKNRWHAFLDLNDAWLIQCMSLDQLMHAIYMCIIKVQWDTGYSYMSIDVGRGYCPLDKSIKLYRDAASGPSLRCTIDQMSLSCSLDFGVIQWSWCRNCSGQNLFLLLTLFSCRFSFNMQVMILTKSYYRLLSLANASLDVCYLYIIIHISISCRIWL